MSTTTVQNTTAEREKRIVALSSVLAAVFITSFKLIIGILTHSLGILAEAAHSGLDLVAAAVTFFAVRVSDRPPDREHLYGHGKVENLSALFEAFLLLVTCAWIIYEAIDRLFFKEVTVGVSIWSFVVMLTSIIVDISRSRALMRMAKKHGSQALEADALHFSTDVWSSSVVIGGLVLLTVGQWLKANTGLSDTWLAWFNRADAIAALGVSIIVIYVSLELGKRTIEGLLDKAPQGSEELIREALKSVAGITKIRSVRIRPSGPATFVDMTIEVARSVSLEIAHAIAAEAKATVLGILPRSDVIVHVDPVVHDETSLVETIRSLAARRNLGIHSIRVLDGCDLVSLEMHVEVPEDLKVSQAHETVSEFETDLRREIPNLETITTHIEPLGEKEIRRSISSTVSEEVQAVLVDLPAQVTGVQECHGLTIHQEGLDLAVSFHCVIAADMSIGLAHRITEQMEKIFRERIPGLGRIVIHTEPPDAKDR